MLTRTDSSGTTTFVWDDVVCVQETDSAGNVTRYFQPNGVLLSFDRTVSSITTTYQVHTDALGSVRKVTDSSGTVKATYDYDAWGNQLPSTSDSIPNGGLMYRFVGALGVRWDAASGLYYMYQRWLDPQLCRFLNRDIVSSTNRYSYAMNLPVSNIDPSGAVVVFLGEPAAIRQLLYLLEQATGLDLDINGGVLTILGTNSCGLHTRHAQAILRAMVSEGLRTTFRVSMWTPQQFSANFGTFPTGVGREHNIYVAPFMLLNKKGWRGLMAMNLFHELAEGRYGAINGTCPDNYYAAHWGAATGAENAVGSDWGIQQPDPSTQLYQYSGGGGFRLGTQNGFVQGQDGMQITQVRKVSPNAQY